MPQFPPEIRVWVGKLRLSPDKVCQPLLPLLLTHLRDWARENTVTRTAGPRDIGSPGGTAEQGGLPMCASVSLEMEVGIEPPSGCCEGESSQ